MNDETTITITEKEYLQYVRYENEIYELIRKITEDLLENDMSHDSRVRLNDVLKYLKSTLEVDDE